MVRAIRQTITVESEGKLELRSAQLHVGAQAEVIILVQTPLEKQTGEAPDWRSFAGCLQGAANDSSDNEKIDLALNESYGADHDPA